MYTHTISIWNSRPDELQLTTSIKVSNGSWQVCAFVNKDSTILKLLDTMKLNEERLHNASHKI